MISTPVMVLLPLKSSNLRAAGYDPATARLVVAFHSQTRYEYFRVPRLVYQRLVQARSHGCFFAAHIRNRYPFRRLA